MRMKSNTLFETIQDNESSKSNLESDYLMVQVIYEYHRVKGILYIVTGQRVGHRAMYQRK